jgi:hypothetical protein
MPANGESDDADAACVSAAAVLGVAVVGSRWALNWLAPIRAAARATAATATTPNR